MVSEEQVDMVHFFLRYMFESERKGHDFYFRSRILAPKLALTSHMLSSHILPLLVERGLVERTNRSQGDIIWRTCFGKEKGAR